jgi:hypothetical protein
MKLPDCFNENQIEKTWEAFNKEYEIDVDAFRYAQSEFQNINKILDKKIEYLKGVENFKDEKTAKISYLLGLAYMTSKL